MDIFKNIPKNRLLLYILLSGIFPVLLAFITVQSKLSSLSDVRSGLQEIAQLAVTQEKKQATNNALRQQFREADHFYIDKHLETLSFLEQEVESLQRIQSNSHFAEDEVSKKRLELLTGPGNSMVFSEGAVQSTPFVQETLETLVHPVEVDGNDLQKILAKIEGVAINTYEPSSNRPQLIITDFRIERKAISDINEVYLLNLKLLKREFP